MKLWLKRKELQKALQAARKKVPVLPKKKTTESQKTENEVNNGNNGDNPEQPVYWDVQIGAFKSKENAKKRAKALSEAGFSSIVIQKTGEIYRVAIKEVKSEDVAELEGKLQEKGFSEYTIRKRNVSKKTD